MLAANGGPPVVEIHLIRHGRSALVHDGRWFRHSDVGAYEDAYDAAGIRDDERPGASLETLVGENAAIVASDLPRAIASARRLAPECRIELSPLLREIRLEPPWWIPGRLPIQVWTHSATRSGAIGCSATRTMSTCDARVRRWTGSPVTPHDRRTSLP
jgi:hypothetical protein